jgi:hypothetical protein
MFFSSNEAYAFYGAHTPHCFGKTFENRYPYAFYRGKRGFPQEENEAGRANSRFINKLGKKLGNDNI